MQPPGKFRREKSQKGDQGKFNPPPLEFWKFSELAPPLAWGSLGIPVYRYRFWFNWTIIMFVVTRFHFLTLWVILIAKFMSVCIENTSKCLQREAKKCIDFLMNRIAKKLKFVEKRFHVFIEINESLFYKWDNIFIANKNYIF